VLPATCAGALKGVGVIELLIACLAHLADLTLSACTHATLLLVVLLLLLLLLLSLVTPCSDCSLTLSACTHATLLPVILLLQLIVQGFVEQSCS
jgi:hypothetical protein